MLGIGPVELFVLMIIALAIPLFLLFVVIKWAVAGGMNDACDSRGQEGRTALQILDERYAKGEIGREEYEMTRRGIEGWSVVCRVGAAPRKTRPDPPKTANRHDVESG